MIYAEVIGDPIAQSKSPVIHKYWLRRLGISADYRKTRVAAADLPAHLGRCRWDSEWLGCNVTIPHKQAIIPLLDRLEPSAKEIGAVNCVVPRAGSLVGYNTDIDGVAAALDSTPLGGRKAAIIGAGGGARAAILYLAQHGADVAILARNPPKAEPLLELGAADILPLDRAEKTFENAAAIVNATSLGMVGADPMPPSLLDAVRAHAAGATVFDMVTTPAETEFLAAGGDGGGRTVDGLTMLVGQAARAFQLFFGVPAPAADEHLRHLLATDRPDSA